MSGLAWTDRVAAPLDGFRRAALGVTFRNGAVRALLATRDRRVAVIIGAHACVALGLTALFPVPLLVLLPLALGVPHVVADLRYLVLGRIADVRGRALALSGCGLLLCVNAVALFGVRFDVARVEVSLGVLGTLVAALMGVNARREPTSVAVRVWTPVVFVVLFALAKVALIAPTRTLIVALHLHNLVALALWLWLFRGRIRAVLPSLLLVFASAGLLAAGLLIPLTLRVGAWRGFGTSLLAAADWLAPGLPDSLAVGLASSWIFLQSVHYLVWLVLVPTDHGPGSGATSFRQSFRALRRDLGASGLMLALLAWLLVLALGARSPLATRNAYLSLASFHLWLEFGALAYFALRGRGAARASS